MLDEVERDLGLWEETIPQAWGKIVGYTSQDAEEVGFEVANGHLTCIASVTLRTFLPWSWEMLQVSKGADLVLVDHMFFLI